MNWYFRVKSRGEVNIDPVQAEFFDTEALGNKSDVLVRETIQNSLDAKAGRGCVRLSFYVSKGKRELEQSERERYIEFLRPHLEAVDDSLVEVSALEEPMDYLLIEDYGTTGLKGAPGTDDEFEMAKDEKNDFFYFWRNIGRSQKEATDRGRWGLGKTVFAASSRINSFFGVTLREGEENRLLMGQSVLQTHHMEGITYCPYGHFGEMKAGLMMPLKDERLVDSFCQHFGIKRDEPGLSLVVAYPDRSIKGPKLVRSIIQHYFYPILRGQLSCRVAWGDECYKIDEANLNELVETFGAGDVDWNVGRLQKRIELVRWGIQSGDTGIVELKAPAVNKAPRMDESLFADAMIDQLRDKFAGGERINLRVPFSIWCKDSGEKAVEFAVFLERDESLDSGDDCYIRDDMTIVGIRNIRRHRVRGIVVVNDPQLGTLLGDSENPAHTTWKASGKRLKAKYEYGPSSVAYVKNSLRDIVAILSATREKMDKKLLSDFFPSEPEEKGISGPTKTPAGPGTGPSRPEEPVVPPPKQPVRLQAVQGGFNVSRNPEVEKTLEALTIEAAYDVRKGNPFKKYRPFDFEFDREPITIKCKGLKITSEHENLLSAEVVEPDFELEAVGFDINRDLKIRVRTIERDGQ